MVAKVGTGLNPIKRRKYGEEPELGGNGGVVRVVALLVFELIEFPKSWGGDAVIGLGIGASLVTGLEHAHSLLPGIKGEMLELARPPAIHARCGVGLGAGGLFHELDGGGRTCRRTWFGFEVVLKVLAEALESLVGCLCVGCKLAPTSV